MLDGTDCLTIDSPNLGAHALQASEYKLADAVVCSSDIICLLTIELSRQLDWSHRTETLQNVVHSLPFSRRGFDVPELPDCSPVEVPVESTLVSDSLSYTWIRYT